MTLVTDIPVWADCPFRDQVPAWIEIRRDGATFCLHSSAHDLHTSLEISFKGDPGERFVEVYGRMVSAMIEAALDQERPGEYIHWMRRQFGQEPPDLPRDEARQARLRELANTA